MINWNTSREDAETIIQIAHRAKRELEMDEAITTIVMDLTATHANGIPLCLSDLLAAPMGDFAHDVLGIRRHINRNTGQLEDCFLPRYAVPE